VTCRGDKFTWDDDIDVNNHFEELGHYFIVLTAVGLLEVRINSLELFLSKLELNFIFFKCLKVEDDVVVGCGSLSQGLVKT